MAFAYTTYGSKVQAAAVRQLLEHALQQSLLRPDRPTPICIWGRHGIGKTELVRDLAAEKGCQLAYIAPAQFEEMGDLLGMPQIGHQPDGNRAYTFFAPPNWVPQTEGPGILLIDDVNRADDRILRGIMQLLQFYELIAWSLPAKWLIVLTANPDGGDYSVTPMDDAMLTRMLHVTMEFDVKDWALWAEKTGVDERGINFVLRYPELVNGKRTTPRSLVQFFQAIREIDHLEEQLPLVKMLGDATLDQETVQAFLEFVHMRLDLLPSPEDILQNESFEQVTDRLARLVNTGATKRLDILSVLAARLVNFLSARQEKISPNELDNLQRFVLLDLLPNDLRLTMAQDIVRLNKPDLQQIYANPEISRLLLEKM